MPLTRKEFERTAVAVWPRKTDGKPKHHEAIGALRALWYVANENTAVMDDVAFLWDVAITRTYMPAHHRLMDAFPRPALP